MQNLHAVSNSICIICNHRLHFSHRHFEKLSNSLHMPVCYLTISSCLICSRLRHIIVFFLHCFLLSRQEFCFLRFRWLRQRPSLFLPTEMTYQGQAVWKQEGRGSRDTGACAWWSVPSQREACPHSQDWLFSLTNEGYHWVAVFGCWSFLCPRIISQPKQALKTTARGRVKIAVPWLHVILFV